MPSPFPGMDPYLEGPQWLSFHTQFSVEIARQLTPRLLPRYVARTPQRYVTAMPETAEGVVVSESSVYPDVSVVERDSSAVRRGGATGMLAAPLEVTTVIPDVVPHVTVEIRDVESGLLVAAIEVLSPTNKQGDGREEYLRRRQRLLLSTAHLMEIDLLRKGKRIPTEEPLPAQPYFVFLSRANRRPITEVWPIALEQPLSTVPVPLLPGDADIPLNLQEAMRNVYDQFGYEVGLDYARPPKASLTQAERAWVEERLQTWRASKK